MGRWQENDMTEEFIRNCTLVKVPESKVVNKKIEQAYQEIRQMQHTAESSKENPNKRRKICSIIAKYTSVAAVFLAIILCFVKNPALAAQLPFIGHIFKDLEQKVSYQGDYSENSITLPVPSPENEGQEKTQEKILSPYQAESGNLTITLSEVSYDSNAIYLALTAENKEGFAQDAQADYLLYLDCQVDMYKTDGSKETFSEATGNSLAFKAEGEFLDSHTFKGIVQLTSHKFNLSDYTSCDISFLEFKQELTTGKTLTGTLQGEDETVCFTEYDWKTYDGNWTFHLDFSDVQGVEQEINVNQTNEQGFGIEKVVKTKYEIYAIPIIPDGKDPFDYVVTIWDADGKPLESHGDNLEIRSVYGRNLSKITIYILSWDDFMECKGNNSYRQPERAVYQTTVNFTD